MAKTVEDLKTLYSELISRRTELAYRVGSATHSEALSNLAVVQTAIQAIRETIELGADEEPSDGPFISFI